MIKQVKKTSDVDEVNRLLDNGWLLMAESIDEFLLVRLKKFGNMKKAQLSQEELLLLIFVNLEDN